MCIRDRYQRRVRDSTFMRRFMSQSASSVIQTAASGSHAVQSQPKLVLGVAGLNASGKSSVCAHLKKAHNAVGMSLSDALRAELKKRNVDESREALRLVGNEMRREHGNGVLATKVLELMDDPERVYVIDSIRHPDEVAALRAGAREFHLVAVECDTAVRYERLRARGRAGDSGASLEEFKAAEAKEMDGGKDGSGQMLGAVLALADVRFANDTTEEALGKAVDQWLKEKNE
eukprot:TRINITY_DN4946_c0_g2_i2.p1 TRINITY_DN4946_c0_g2~~TRINITY_DN4946_c0_g2_i2.p1  ORF type:complete len:232 (-),score=74.90 TRINITY_DN4946_c0_g2_i2:38-733(-)